MILLIKHTYKCIWYLSKLSSWYFQLIIIRLLVLVTTLPNKSKHFGYSTLPTQIKLFYTTIWADQLTQTHTERVVQETKNIM